MFASFQNGRTILARLSSRAASLPQARAKTDGTLRSSMLVATSDSAQRLKKTAATMRLRGRKKGKESIVRAIEPRRVNIVSEELCDDTVKYLGPSLERHRGCDLVDLSPGVGIWSRKLHDFLEPRKHVMMDLDAELYRPYLSDLLSRKNVELIPKSGLVWKDLFEMIHTHLANQVEAATPSCPKRNDTLLVTANLSMCPKKAFHGFDSVSTMVLYQLMSSIRTSSLFQRYGLVRMLIWVNDEDKRRLIPRSINRRKRSAFDAELACEWIHEVVGHDAEFQDRTTLRDEWLNVESGCRTMERMASQGLVMPAGRESRTYTDLRHRSDLIGQKLAGVRPPTLTRPFKHELETLEESVDSIKTKEGEKRLKFLRQRDKYDQQHSAKYLELLQQLETTAQLGASSSEFGAADRAWNERIGSLNKNGRDEFNVLKDSYHLFRQNPTGLLWDRRAYEPLAAKAEEFFPNAPTALLDIQPKAMHPLLRQHGPNTSRAGDMSEVMLRFWFHHTLLPVPKAMEGLWGGFGELVAECPSIVDINRGGTPLTGHGALTVRSMNEEQWVEILQAWMNWPFRPTYTQMLGRLVEDADPDVDEEETKSGAGGLAY